MKAFALTADKWLATTDVPCQSPTARPPAQIVSADRNRASHPHPHSHPRLIPAQTEYTPETRLHKHRPRAVLHPTHASDGVSNRQPPHLQGKQRQVRCQIATPVPDRRVPFVSPRLSASVQGAFVRDRHRDHPLQRVPPTLHGSVAYQTEG